MLFILTGDVQTGKTRWLQAVVEALSQNGVLCSGVLAPGDWIPKPEGGFEKLGINNTLLPQSETIPFARRADLARAEGTFDPNSASARSQLAWEISEVALATVNSHFAVLARGKGEQGAFGCFSGPELLIVDELGRLELQKEEGLTEAITLVKAGTPEVHEADSPDSRGSSDAPYVATPKHCLIVVRDYLVSTAQEKFARAWGDTLVISPNDEDECTLREALGVITD